MCDVVSVFDIAKYILERTGEITAIKLQKLVYYSQVWNLVWDEEPLFYEQIEAWANGPVIPVLYDVHRGYYSISPDMIPGDSSKLSSKQRANIDTVIKFYGDKTSLWLSRLSHNEDPWLSSRIGLEPGERGTEDITLDSIADYYSSL